MQSLFTVCEMLTSDVEVLTLVFEAAVKTTPTASVESTCRLRERKPTRAHARTHTRTRSQLCMLG